MSKALQRNLEAKLAAMNGPEWDSSDEEDEVEAQSKPVEFLDGDDPGSAKTDKKGKNASKTQKSSSEAQIQQQVSNVVYIGHLPAGFEEHQIKGFFEQFGPVMNLRVSRSKKTGNLKGFAFVRFHEPEVAKIVADAMNGYFLMDKRLICNLVPVDKMHPRLFEGKYYRNKNTRSEAIETVNRKRTKEEMQKRSDRYLSRESKRLKKLAGLGIDYGFSGSVVAVATEEEKSRTVSVDEGDQTSGEKTPVRNKTAKSAKKSTKKSEKKDKSKASSDVAKVATPAATTPKKKEVTSTANSTKKSAKKEKAKVSTDVEKVATLAATTPKKKEVAKSTKKSAKKEKVKDASGVLKPLTPAKKVSASAMKSVKKSTAVKDADMSTPKKRSELDAPSTKKKRKVKSSVKKSKKI